MNYYVEPQKNLEIAAGADVLVVGSGPAGFSAAVAAARIGAKTVIIEQSGNIGGMSTIGLMSHWVGRAKSKIYEEILAKSAELNEGELHGVRTRNIDHEKLKTLYLDMLISAGADIRLYTLAADVIMEENKLRGVITESKSGRQAIFSKVVIDASGDGDIAARAGAGYIKGRETDGLMQPMTIMFKVAGVDKSRMPIIRGFESTFDAPRGELQALAKEHLPYPAGHVLLYDSTLPGIVVCNMTNSVDSDGTSSVDLTRATLTCRHQMDKIVAFLREFVPGFENCFMIDSASFIGVRETRHFKGVYTLTENDIAGAREFDDWVVRDAYFNFDVHNLTGPGLDSTGAQKKFVQKKGYSIPYGCLVPEKIDNLLLSGRNISGTHMAHSNFRVMPICAATGEAAGVAAALAVRNGIMVRDVPVGDIQKELA